MTPPPGFPYAVRVEIRPADIDQFGEGIRDKG
jgi:hypothetical protein